MLDIHIPLPPVDSLSMEDARALNRHLLTELRPAMLHRFTEIGQMGEPDTAVQIEQLEMELRLKEIDNYHIALDRRLTDATRPAPSYQMSPDLAEIEIEGTAVARARAALFYSPEAKFNVHGPIMLFHIATLAERLFQPGESFEALESVAFSKMVISELRITVYDPKSESSAFHKAGARAASIIGTFRLTSGRKLAFYGIQDHAYPVQRACWINYMALSLVPEGYEHRLEGGTYFASLKNEMPPDLPSAEDLSAPAELMTLIDIIVLMMMSQTMHSDETKLLLAIRQLPMCPGMIAALRGTVVALTPQVDRARTWNGDIVMMPTDVTLNALTDRTVRIFTAETDLPYYRMPVS